MSQLRLATHACRVSQVDTVRFTDADAAYPALTLSGISTNASIGSRRYRVVASIQVEDDGPGVPAELKDTVFYPLVTGRPGGTGLGLSIALEDARLHNGELDAWGRPGKGAHFVLTLPRVAGKTIQGRPIKVAPKDFHEENFFL